MSRILVIEDSRDLALGLRTNLEIEGHEVLVAADGEEGLAAAASWRPDLVILDLMIPRVDGFTVLQRLRRGDAETPVLILTARAAEVDKVRGLRSGADDYLTKPFGLMEFLARVESLLRRGAGSAATGMQRQYRFGAVELDTVARRVCRSGVEIGLSPREYELLLELVRHTGQVVTRQQLLRRVWGHQAVVASRTIDTHVAELRRKLGGVSGEPRLIATIRKVGYRFDPAPGALAPKPRANL